MPTPSPIHESKDIPWQARGAVSPEHAATILSISRRLLYDRIAAGEINAIKLGSRTVVPVAEIFRLLNAAKPQTQKRKPRRVPSQQPEAS